MQGSFFLQFIYLDRTQKRLVGKNVPAPGSSIEMFRHAFATAMIQSGITAGQAAPWRELLVHTDQRWAAAIPEREGTIRKSVIGAWIFHALAKVAYSGCHLSISLTPHLTNPR